MGQQRTPGAPAGLANNAAVLIKACRSIDEVHQCWPQVLATLERLVKRRRITDTHLAESLDWLDAVIHQPPFDGPEGESFRADIVRLTATITGRPLPTPWNTSLTEADGNYWPEGGDGS
jgi:hypothetical protein